LLHDDDDDDDEAAADRADLNNKPNKPNIKPTTSKSGNQPAVLHLLSAIALVWKSGFQISLKKKT
jgi:hypothetical protein